MKPPLNLPLNLLLQMLFLAAMVTVPLQGQANQTASVLMLSDIHLDPFHDPAKLPQLRATPIAEWAAILSAAPSPTQPADFAQLQSTCGARGIDTPNALLESSLHAAHTQQPKPLFVTVSGDLMAHNFDCRFKTLAPTATPAEYSAFAAKTVAFVALRLHQTFPATPIYLALGNNDSGCKDYREDPGSAFLQAAAAAFAADATTPANAASITREFSQYGDYNVSLPIPHARLIVLQDIFESSRYTTCDGKTSTEVSAAQIAWLRTQLEHARAANEHVWLMAHIPPGIDAYSTFSKGRNLCSATDHHPAEPVSFLSSDALADTIYDFWDVISLALFGHTHMDEFRGFSRRVTQGSNDLHVTFDSVVPGKLVPSISPVNGNYPAFTLADLELDPNNAFTSTMIKDYAVFVANNQTGIDAAWSQEYRFSTTYHQPDLSGRSIAKLIHDLRADTSGTTDLSRSYERYFYVTDPALPSVPFSIIPNLKAVAMQAVWPAYTCSLMNPRAAAFRACVCPVPPPSPPAQ